MEYTPAPPAGARLKPDCFAPAVQRPETTRLPTSVVQHCYRLPNGAELADTWEMSRISFLAAILCCRLAGAQSPSSVASTIVASANGFLSSLDEGQRSKVLFDFNDAAQRVKWSNLPTTMVPRAGLKMGDLSEAQRKAAMGLLAATLSKRGYEKVLAIMAGDERGSSIRRSL